MSKHDEQELTKWKNKFRLWRILHPNDIICGCIHCPYSFGNCDNEETLIYNRDRDIIVSKKEYSSDEAGRNEICVEWIKNV
jgi:hypothetical protein